MATKPVLKDKLRSFLKEWGLSARVFYRIVEINNPEFLQSDFSGSAPPKVGESFAIEYDFMAESGATFGYEHLNLFIFRQDGAGRIHNYVRRFTTVEDLAKALHGVKVVLDKEFAQERIRELQQKIEKLEKDYELG